MRLLLDTCTFLWWIAGDRALVDSARALVSDPENDAYVSAVSAWEIAVKHGMGRLPLPEPPERFVPRERERHGFATLPLDEASMLHVHRLPRLHRDPFDRMLVCQAVEHGMTLVTPDALVTQYPVRSAW